MSPRSDESNIIMATTEMEPFVSEVQQRKRFFSPLFRMRRGIPKTIYEEKVGKQEDQSLEDTDENSLTSSSSSSSGSSSFDIIDSLLATLDGEDESSTAAVAPDATQLGTATYDDIPNSSVHACLKLLASEDIDQNRVGLQRLVLLTMGRTLSGLHHSEEVISHILVFGGPMGSIEERLRYVFATMICDSPHDDHQDEYIAPPLVDFDEKEALFDWILDYDPATGMDGNGHHISYYDNSNNDNDDDNSSHYMDDDESEMEPSHPQGKNDGALHTHALRVLSNALGKVASTRRMVSAIGIQEQIPLHGPIWKNITRSLVENIETNRNADATKYSLKILRLLHFIHPELIGPLLKYTLFEHLVFLTEYGEGHSFPMIQSEASYLLNKAEDKLNTGASSLWI